MGIFFDANDEKNGLILPKKGPKWTHFRSLFLVQNGDVLNGLSRGIGGAQRSPNKVVCATKWLANIELAKPLQLILPLETESVLVV